MAKKNKGKRLFVAIDNVFVAAFPRRRAVFYSRVIFNDVGVLFGNDNRNEIDFGNLNVVFVAIDTV